MKIAVTIARYLLGLVFTVFGLNGFLHFIPQPPPDSPLALQYFTVMSASHYLVLVYLIEVVAGLLLLANYYVPLAITLLGPVIVNIFLFHVLMSPSGLGMAVFITVLWLVVFLGVRQAFGGIKHRRQEQGDGHHHRAGLRQVPQEHSECSQQGGHSEIEQAQGQDDDRHQDRRNVQRGRSRHAHQQ